MLTISHHLTRPLGGVQIDGDGHKTVVDVLVHLVPGLAEDAQHPLVLRQHLSGEPAHPTLAGGGSNVLQQHRSQTSTLLGVGDVEGHLGFCRSGTVKTGNSDDVLSAPIRRITPAGRGTNRDQCDSVTMVNSGKSVQIPVWDSVKRREEPQIGGLL
jgi:hypothetical protein